MPAPIALLTDFGLSDPYVGIMKGVLLTRAPGAPLFDLTHHIPPQNVLVGALQLRSAVEYCPPHTVFLAVVDPGVGSTRRPLCIRSSGHLFVGPDNGLLWPAASHLGSPEAFHLDRPEFWLPQPGATFHGRDIFAPCAAALAAGTPPEALGTLVLNPTRLEFPSPQHLPTGITGEVLLVDHFGNAITNLTPAHLGHPPPQTLTFRFGAHALPGPATHYGAVPPARPLVLLGSFGYYEIAINGGNAAAAFSLAPGSPVQVSSP